jgi:hypothetical protein
VSSSAQTQANQAHSRAVVWIDHFTARIFSMGLTGVTASVVHAHLSSPHLHHKANSIGDGRVQEDPAFLTHVADVVSSCREMLILGPGAQKTALLHHLQSTYPQMMLRLETCDHPTDPEISRAAVCKDAVGGRIFVDLPLEQQATPRMISFILALVGSGNRPSSNPGSGLEAG